MLLPCMNYRSTKAIRCTIGLILAAFVSVQLINRMAHSSTGFHPTQEVEKVAKKFLEDHYQSDLKTSDDGFQVQVFPLNSRVNLKACDQHLEGFWPYEPANNRKVSVGVRCTGTSRWKVYVQAQLKMIKPVAVLNSPVSKGESLSEDLISMQKTDTLTLRATAVDDLTSLLGMTFKRNLRAGTVLSPQHLKIPVSVKRGDIVNILSGSGSIAVRAQGFALADGHLNQLIKVRNSTSKQIVQATVVKPGTVRIVQ